MGVKRKLRITTAPVERVLAEICAAIPITSATTVTVIPLSCARLKMEAPSMEKELRENPVRMKKMIKIAGFVEGKRPTLASTAITIHDGK